MIICLCHRVSDRDIAREVRSGCGNFDELQDLTRVSTACGACRECAEATFTAHAGAAYRPPMQMACGARSHAAATA